MINLQNSVDENGVADARHILIDEVWPEDYEDSNLIQAVEKIMIEWNKLNGIEHDMDELLYKQDSNLYDRAKLEALELAYICCNLAESAEILGNIKEKELCLKECDDILNKFNIYGLKTKHDIEQKSKQIEQKIKDDIKENIRKHKHKKNINFYDLIIPIEIYFKKDIDENITCAKFISYVNKLKNVS